MPELRQLAKVANRLATLGHGGDRKSPIGDSITQDGAAELLNVGKRSDEPAAFVVSLNLHRRHLSESQRAMVAARLATLTLGANQHAPIGAPSTSQDEAADLLNVARRSVQRARIVEEQGTPELVHAVDAGVVSAAADVATHAPAHFTPPRPCWRCDFFDGMADGHNAAVCTLPLAARVRSQPANGCSAFEREPGADDEPLQAPPASGSEKPGRRSAIGRRGDRGPGLAPLHQQQPAR